MKNYCTSAVLFNFLLFFSFLYPQAYQTYPDESTAETKSDSTWYVVRGERHGISFFKYHFYEEVEYTAGEKLTFDKYHTAEVMYTWLKRWAEKYPDIFDVYEVGRSFEGRSILQVTLTDKKTDKDTNKPAAFFEGGRHSGEVTSSESVLWLIKHLLENYGKDQQITDLINTKTIYLRPQNNPDGSNLYLYTAQRNRSSVRPYDSDGDGLVDEDSYEDLDKDGIIYNLRWPIKAGNEDQGNAILDPRDPSGRLMKLVPDGQGDWRLESEGVDNDGDGKFNEDGIGGLDLHRNYPENWRPDKNKDLTKRGYTQTGAGDFPLSEPETRTVVLWLLTHPNISVCNSMDTSVPMHLRPPSTSKSVERMFKEDLDYYQYFDKIGVSITNYPWAGDVYDTYMTRYPFNPRTGDPTQPSPLFGHGPDFGYFYYGAIWYGDELWNGGKMDDYNKDGLLDEVDALIWDDKFNGGKGFREWESFNHPDLGKVEIGGFRPKFFSQNGPPALLEEGIKKQAMFNLELAFHLPQLELTDLSVNCLKSNSDSATFKIALSWKNTGKLPTALKQAQLIKIVQEDRAQLEFDKELTKGKSPELKIVDPATYDKSIRAGYTQVGETKKVSFTVRTYVQKNIEGKVKVLSTRGGFIEKSFILAYP
jgi:hypothetical protein